MKFYIQNIQYPPGKTVGCLIQDENRLGHLIINVRQEDLPAAWMDADVVAACQAKLDNPDFSNELPAHLLGKGHIIELEPVSPPLAQATADDRMLVPPPSDDPSAVPYTPPVRRTVF